MQGTLAQKKDEVSRLQLFKDKHQQELFQMNDLIFKNKEKLYRHDADVLNLTKELQGVKTLNNSLISKIVSLQSDKEKLNDYKIQGQDLKELLNEKNKQIEYMEKHIIEVTKQNMDQLATLEKQKKTTEIEN